MLGVQNEYDLIDQMPQPRMRSQKGGNCVIIILRASAREREFAVFTK